MKTKTNRQLILSMAFILTTVIATAQGLTYNEETDGDLSDQFDAPSGPFILEAGDNNITADQQGNPRDIDYITITLPPDLQLDQLVLDGYTAEGTNNEAFIGLQEGNAFTTDAMTTTASDLLGGMTYGGGNLDTDLLPQIGQLGTGFTPPLPTGTYTFWLNQTGPNSLATLRFVVSGTLDIEEVTTQNDIVIYPNPVRETLRISAPGTAVQKLEIYNITGQLIVSQATLSPVTFSATPSGIYFVKVFTISGIITQKINKL